MQFYNTLNRKKEEFQPLEKGKVKLYTCGPTVYDFAHIGNLRAFLFEDILRRYLEFEGLQVLHVMNITDIDDKTIRRSQEEKRPLFDFTEEYTQAFFDDLNELGGHSKNPSSSSISNSGCLFGNFIFNLFLLKTSIKNKFSKMN